jgi:hypothetical protein
VNVPKEKIILVVLHLSSIPTLSWFLSIIIIRYPSIILLTAKQTTRDHCRQGKVIWCLYSLEIWLEVLLLTKNMGKLRGLNNLENYMKLILAWSVWMDEQQWWSRIFPISTARSCYQTKSTRNFIIATISCIYLSILK